MWKVVCDDLPKEKIKSDLKHVDVKIYKYLWDNDNEPFLELCFCSQMLGEARNKTSNNLSSKNERETLYLDYASNKVVYLCES